MPLSNSQAADNTIDLEQITSFISSGIQQAQSTALLFLESVTSQLNLLGILDIAAIFGLLYWISRKLRRSELQRAFPRLLILLAISLIARLIGLWALFYFTGGLFVISVLAVASLYAAEIKALLETAETKHQYNRPQPITTADLQTMIRSVCEAMAVLVRSQKSVLIVIKKHKPVQRLIENGTKMHAPAKPEAIIDIFSGTSQLAKGAVIIEGNHLVSAGSTLWQPNAKVLFSATNPAVMRVARDMKAVVILSNKTIGDIHVLDGENSYKNISPQDLVKLLQNIFIYHSTD